MADAQSAGADAPPERLTAKARKFAQREQAILNATADLIAHYGYDKTTVEDIAHAAHVSKGAVYLHFTSKEVLVDKLMLREAERMMTAMAARFSGGQSVGLIALIRSSLIAIAENPLMRALFGKDRRVLGDYARRAAKLPIVQQAMTFNIDFVRQSQAAGLMRRDLTPESISYLLLILRYGLFTIHDFVPQDQAPPIEDVSAAIAALLEGGFATNDDPQDEAARAVMDSIFAYAAKVITELNRPAAADGVSTALNDTDRN